ncbi:tyrosine-type recombinase/integrase [Gordonia sp. (in: high G+C Gram-positive bacteria)]|uniref:tyrosine-type recombinase/integrase n=1 Tax=Gordonia sp. (in: high G+C Gram-positive bacteria) TaxID=84139 RepID=UPI003F9751C9
MKRLVDRSKDAHSYLATVAVNKNRGDWIDPKRQKVTLRTLVEREAHRADAENTRLSKKAAAANLGRLGGMPIGTIGSQDIEDWLTELQDGRPWADGKPLGASSISIYLRTVKTALNRAVDASPPLIAKSPAAKIRPPKGTEERDGVSADEIPTTADVLALVDAASKFVRRGKTTPAKTPLATMITLQASTGLGPGEICGLRRSDVDLKGRALRVRVQSARSAAWTWADLKTPSSRRDVPIPDRALAMLKTHMSSTAVQAAKRATDRESKDVPVFQTRAGGMYTSTTYAEAFAAALHRCLPDADWTPHDLRHYYASLLIAKSVDVASVQAYLGHSSANETLRTYTHFWPDKRDLARTAVNEVL